MDDERAREMMSDLATSFPCLREAPGVDPFDAKELDRWASGPLSHGEQVTARFLLAVWDSSNERRAGRVVIQAEVLDWFEREAKPEAPDDDDAEELDEAGLKSGGA